MNTNGLMLFLRAMGLFLFWILLSGKLDWFHLGVGAACAALIARLSPAVSTERLEIRARQIPMMLVNAFLYSFWLLSRIVLAAVHVSKLILHPKMPIDPEVIRHSTFLKHDIEKVIFANSITLTPGTITADISGNEFVVHSLDKSSAGDIVSRAMEKKIQQILQKAVRT